MLDLAQEEPTYGSLYYTIQVRPYFTVNAGRGELQSKVIFFVRSTESLILIAFSHLISTWLLMHDFTMVAY